MRERIMNHAATAAALGLLVLGVSLQWAFVTVVYAALGTLVLGLAAPRGIVYIAALSRRKGRT